MEPPRTSATPVATTVTSLFRRSVSVATEIDADPERVWALLTDADGMARWNTTVASVVGPIEQGRKLRIKVPVSDRTFTPKVTELVPASRMVWSDGVAPMFRGVRVFDLAPAGTGATRFSMTETFTGVMLPVIARSLPDFAPIFERYAADLKHAAEQGGSA